MIVEDVVFSHGTVVVEIGGRRAGDMVDFCVSTMIDVDEFLAHFVALNRLPLCIVPVRRFLPAEIVDWISESQPAVIAGFLRHLSMLLMCYKSGGCCLRTL